MSTPDPMTNCPGNEDLAAFADGRLNDVERRRMEEHIDACEDCYAQVSAVWDFQASENGGGQIVRPRFGGGTWTAVASLAAAATLAVVFIGPIRDYRSMRAIVAASNELERRPVDGRLSGDFAYRRPVPVTRGDVPNAELSELRLQAAAAEALEKTKNAHLAGVALLLLGEEEEAVKKLTEAANASPDDARILSDLATAHLAVAKRTGNKNAQDAARETAERAWKLERTPQTAWNRALAINSRAAWNDYLAIDPSSPWAAEAREAHLPYAE